MKQEFAKEHPKSRVQEMADYAWRKTRQELEKELEKENFVRLAKGAPALVMANGLMQALAYWQARGKEAGKALVGILAGWLLKSERPETHKGFKELMEKLHRASSSEFARDTREAIELLRWVKQFASALGEK